MNNNGQESNTEYDTLQQLQNFRNNLPVGISTSSEVVEDKKEATVENEEKVETPIVNEGVVVDGQTFANEKEAYDYVQKQLASAKQDALILEAKNQAYEEAMNRLPFQGAQAPAVAPAEPVDDIDQFYENPAEYLKKIRREIYDGVKHEIQSTMTEQQKEEAQWKEFFTANPDLEGFQDDCQGTLNRHREQIALLARKDKALAMNYLANKTREKFQSYIERTKPRKTLSNDLNQVSVGTPNVTYKQNTQQEDENIDFATQLRSLRGGR